MFCLLIFINIFLCTYIVSEVVFTIVMYKQEDKKNVENTDVDENHEMKMEEYDVECGKIVIKQIGNVNVNVFRNEEDLSPPNDTEPMLNEDENIESWGIVNIYIKRDSTHAHNYGQNDDWGEGNDATVANPWKLKSKQNHHIPELIATRSEEISTIVTADHDVIDKLMIATDRECHIRCCVIL